MERKRFRQPAPQTVWVPRGRTGKIMMDSTMRISTIIKNPIAAKIEKLKFASTAILERFAGYKRRGEGS